MTISVTGAQQYLKSASAYGDATLVVPDRGVGALMSVNLVTQRLAKLVKTIEDASAKAEQRNRDTKRQAILDLRRQNVFGSGSTGSTGGVSFSSTGSGSSGGGGHGSNLFAEFLEAKGAWSIGKRLLGRAIPMLNKTRNLIRPVAGTFSRFLGPIAAALYVGNDIYNSFTDPEYARKATKKPHWAKDFDQMFSQSWLGQEQARIHDTIVKKWGSFTDVVSQKTSALRDASVRVWDEVRSSLSGNVAALSTKIHDGWKSFTETTAKYSTEVEAWLLAQGTTLNKWFTEVGETFKKQIFSIDLRALAFQWIGALGDWIKNKFGVSVTPGNPNDTPPSEMTPADMERNSNKDKAFAADPESARNDPTRVGGTKGGASAAPVAIPNADRIPAAAGGPAMSGPVSTSPVIGTGTLPIKTSSGKVVEQDVNNMSGQAVGGGATDKGIVNLAQVMKADPNFPGGFGTVSGFNDTYHKYRRGPHAMGLATDFTLKDGSPQTYQKANDYIRTYLTKAGMTESASEMGKGDFWIEPQSMTSGSGSTAPHVHVNFTSHDAAKKFSDWAAADPVASAAIGATPATSVPQATPKDIFKGGLFTGRAPPPAVPYGKIASDQQGGQSAYPSTGHDSGAASPSPQAPPDPMFGSLSPNAPGMGADYGAGKDNVGLAGQLSYFGNKAARAQATPDSAPQAATVSESIGESTAVDHGDDVYGPTTAPATKRRKGASMDSIPTIPPDIHAAVKVMSDTA